VKKTVVFGQILFCDTVTVSDGVVTGFTVILTLLLFTTDAVGQVAFDVRTHQTESELTIVLVP
jgi:hypothetical protein